MGKYNTVRDGRMSYSYLVEEDTKAVTSLEVGKLYHITKKASTGSVFGDVLLNKAWYCAKTATLAEGDECHALKLGFLGFVNNKSLNFSKETQDVTVDKDGSKNYITDGNVESSGTLEGYDLMQEGADSAINKIRSRFTSVILVGADATTYIESDTSASDVILIVWDARDLKTGGIFEADLIPCFITSQDRSASYNSPQGMTLNFQGKDSSDDGLLKTHFGGVYAGGFAAV